MTRLKKEKDQKKRKLPFIGYLFGKLSRVGATAYLVGGQAVEVYTGGQFSTGDIDITTDKREAVENLLLQLKFAKEGMIWLNEEVGMAVHIVASYPTRTEKSRTILIEGSQVKIVGVEDLMIDRLVSAKYWRSNQKLDLEEAATLRIIFRDGLDLAYLKKRAAEEKVTDFLDAILGKNRV